MESNPNPPVAKFLFSIQRKIVEVMINLKLISRKLVIHTIQKLFYNAGNTTVSQL